MQLIIRDDLTVKTILLRHRTLPTQEMALNNSARYCLANVETFENSIYHVVWPMGGRVPSQRGGHAPRQVLVFEVEL